MINEYDDLFGKTIYAYTGVLSANRQYFRPAVYLG